MARLKLREVLLPKLVKPEENHKPPLPLQRIRESAGGCSVKNDSSKDNRLNALSEACALGCLYPWALTEDMNLVVLCFLILSGCFSMRPIDMTEITITLIISSFNLWTFIRGKSTITKDPVHT